MSVMTKPTIFILFFTSLLMTFINPSPIFAQTASNGFLLRNISSGAELGAYGNAVIGGFDLDNDGFGEFIVFTDNTLGQLRIYEATADNNYSQVSFINLADTAVGPAGNVMDLGNLDADNPSEIIVTFISPTFDIKTRIFDLNPSTFAMSEHPNSPAPPTPDLPFAVTIVGDTDGDNKPEFVVCNVGGTNGLQAYEWNGSGWAVISQVDVNLSTVDMAVDDTDGDGKKEIAVVSENGLEIFKLENGILSPDGTVSNNISTFNIFKNQKVEIGDIDQNGSKEIVLATVGLGDRGIFVFENTGGNNYDRDELSSFGIKELMVGVGDIEIGDYNNDGKSEIYWSEISYQNTVDYVEFAGTTGSFTAIDFRLEVNIFTTDGSDVFVFDYISGGNRMLDKDLYRDIVLVTEPDLEVEEVFVIESSTEDLSLPVTLFSFNAQVNEDRVELQWVTESEINNEAFLLERGENGKNFSLIAVIPGHGTTTTQHEYNHTDNDVIEGKTYYYRLADRDYGGKLQYHQILTVTAVGATPDKFFLHPVYPNPFNPMTNIKIEIHADEISQRSAHLNVYNSIGELVRTIYSGPLHNGIHLMTWDGLDNNGSFQPSGTYILRLQSGSLMQVQKLILVR